MAKATTQTDLLDGLNTHKADPFLNIATVAEALGRHPTTVGRWVVEGAIRATRFPNGTWKIRKSDLELLLAGSSIQDDAGVVSRVEKLTEEEEE